MFRKHFAEIVTMATLLAASGTAYGQAQRVLFTAIQVYVAFLNEATTWSQGGMSHIRDRTTLAYTFYSTGKITSNEITADSDVNADGAGLVHGTFIEYDFFTREFFAAGTFTEKHPAFSVSGVWDTVEFVGHNGTILRKGTITVYADPVLLDPILHASPF